MILVTGATGTVGREVVRVLCDSGLAARAAVRDPQAARALLGEGLEYVRFEFGRPATYAAAFANVRAMFLMRPPSITNVRSVIEPAVNAGGHAGLERGERTLQGSVAPPAADEATRPRLIVIWTDARGSAADD